MEVGWGVVKMSTGQAGAVPTRPAVPTSVYRGYRFLPDVIAHAVWFYFRFHLSFGEVQDLLVDRGMFPGPLSRHQRVAAPSVSHAGTSA